ncbi:unnamed protein product [Mytilus coruscus]|uniref:Uncharacterized protein n=1 Tax=Mytilus coruscus TaxID=42192 RepID=A0A6J7ZUY6_MYTCO|nr:unnamed protein product [Mytilus coruscus]
MEMPSLQFLCAEKTRHSFNHSDLQEQALPEPCTLLLQEIEVLQNNSKLAYRFNCRLDNPLEPPTQNIEYEFNGICAIYQPRHSDAFYTFAKDPDSNLVHNMCVIVKTLRNLRDLETLVTAMTSPVQILQRYRDIVEEKLNVKQYITKLQRELIALNQKEDFLKETLLNQSSRKQTMPNT